MVFLSWLVMDADWKEYVGRYYHDGKWWGLNITARDWSDAEARAAKLGNLQILGELKGTIPAQIPGAGLLVRLWTTIKNIGKSE